VAELEKERGEQTVTIADSGPARKLLTIELPQSRIQAKIEGNYGKLRDEAAVPGFRRGRAPQRLLQKKFGKAVRDEAKGQLLSECYTQAIEENKLDVIGEPDVKDFDTLELPESGGLTFTVEVEVSPEVTLPDFAGLTVIKPKREVSEEAVTQEIDRYREQFGKIEPVAGDDVKVAVGDYVLADVKVMAGESPASDAEPIVANPSTYIIVRGKDGDYKGHVMGIVVDDLGQRLIDQKPGAVVTIAMTGPASHEHDAIKGQPITILIKITEAQRVKPAGDEDMLQHFGVENMEALRERVQTLLKSRFEREQTAAMHEQANQWLNESVNFELPMGMTSRQTQRVLQRRAMELAYQGVPHQEIEHRIAQMRSESEADARKQLKTFFILDKAAKQLEVEIAENEINGRIYMMAMQQGRRPEKLRQELARRGELEYLYLSIREDKTLNKILEKANVTEGEYEAKAGA
jgi:trigger factor